jgi:histidinol-phosphatase
MDDLGGALDVALETARAGARIAMGHFGKDPDAKRKEDGSWATQGDWETEAQIRIRLSRAFPDHNILGEEEGLTRAGGGEPLDGAPTWIVDPIDGTNNYMAGIPIWATLIALRVEGSFVLGVAHSPALGETYDAALGKGARLNGAAIHTDESTALADATFCYAGVRTFEEQGLRGFYDALVARTWRSRGFGDFWGHMLVARGAAHVMAEPRLNVWDVAALVPIVTESGGRITDLEGNDWTETGPCMTSTTKLHDEVLSLVRQT